MNRKLTKSPKDYSLQGVFGGIAEYFGWSSFRVRLTFVVLTVASGFIPGIIAYVILSFLMPMPEEKDKFDLDKYRVQ
jgi:phage shock protein PspC (stress-responsive transcriptional regulator)